MSRAAIPDLRSLRRSWKQVRTEPRMTDAQRAHAVALRAHISEHNRHVKLEARRDAHERLVTARAKRARRNARRRYEADCRLFGLASAHWIMGGHA